MDFIGIDLHKTSSRVCILTADMNGVSAGGGNFTHLRGVCTRW